MAKREKSAPIVLKKKTPRHQDVMIGARLRLARTLIGMSQEKLGDALGITFQQVQKYEKGTNRIGGSRMAEIAFVLKQPVNFFFADLDVTGEPDAAAQLISPGDRIDGATVRVVRNFNKIKDTRIRNLIAEMVAIFAGVDAEEAEEA